MVIEIFFNKSHHFRNRWKSSKKQVHAAKNTIGFAEVRHDNPQWILANAVKHNRYVFRFHLFPIIIEMRQIIFAIWDVFIDILVYRLKPIRAFGDINLGIIHGH